MLDPAVELAHRHAEFFQLVAEQADDAFDVAFPIDALALELVGDLLVDVRFQHAQGPVFQLPLELGDAEPVGQRREDVPGLQGVALLLLRGQGAHVAHQHHLQGQLQHHGAHVRGQGQQHFAQALQIGLLLLVELVDEGELVEGLENGQHLRMDGADGIQ